MNCSRCEACGAAIPIRGRGRPRKFCSDACTRDALCGTSAGYAWHSKRGEKPCEPCREGRRAYINRHLAENRNPRRKTSVRTRAYGAAMAKLRERHRAEFDLLYEDACREQGVR